MCARRRGACAFRRPDLVRMCGRYKLQLLSYHNVHAKLQTWHAGLAGPGSGCGGCGHAGVIRKYRFEKIKHIHDNRYAPATGRLQATHRLPSLNRVGCLRDLTLTPSPPTRRPVEELWVMHTSHSCLLVSARQGSVGRCGVRARARTSSRTTPPTSRRTAREVGLQRGEGGALLLHQ